jgi:D-alanyl-D-alanine carboxypeptidase
MRACSNYIYAVIALAFIGVLGAADLAYATRSSSKTGVHDPRYAALIMDPTTGEILHQQNANAKRYPASLTKMMTLYLLFEQMEKGKITSKTKMKASRYAASQPQTNISLKAGDRVPLSIVIKSLIVRSANDVSVVVAEHISDNVASFARLATKRARELGMKNTTFRNPHGLPNAKQVTTAADMAKLAIALKRDFPQYYHYFKTQKFSWRGKTYYTHNRVMKRYSGADGLKTGYIRASGFNLATSVERGGRKLIGVVMGGATGTWRDDRMIALLSSGYRTLAKRGGSSKKRYAQHLPSYTPAQQARIAAREKAAAEKQKLAQANATKRDISANSRAVIRSASAQEKVTLGAGYVQASAPLRDMWGIQVGAFVDRQQAEQAVAKAYTMAQKSLKGSRVAVVDAGISGNQIHRARLENLSQEQARVACRTLVANDAPCFVYRATPKS